MALDDFVPSDLLRLRAPGDTHPHWKSVGRGNTTLWSGLDAAIWVDDLYLAQVVALQYEVQEAVYPLYPYAAYRKQGSLHGQRRVFGAFTINFQNALFFWMVLEHLRRTDDPLPAPEKPAAIARTGRASAAASILNKTHLQSPKSFDPASAQALSPDAARSLYGVLTAAPGQTARQTLAGTARILSGSKLSEASAQAALMRQRYAWAQAQPNVPAGHGANLLQAVYDALSIRGSRPLFDTTPDGFTISAVLGDPNPSDYEGLQADPGPAIPSPYGADYLRLSAAVGDRDVPQALALLPPWTTLRIVGAEINGFGGTLDDSGRPLLQTYSFIASDVF